jgi:predicted chitinase
VDRVLSNYFYLTQRLQDELQEEQKNLNILSKLKRSLSEYVMYQPHQNRMNQFLAGIELEQLFFVGFTENYNESMERLANLLGWENYEAFYHNKTEKRKFDVSDAEIDLIRRQNQIDIELYEKALELLEKGRWKA